jgi:general stress protein YciG
MYTYIAIDLESKKFYIGSTKSFSHRQKRHLRGDIQLPFQSALKKRPDSFFWFVTENVEDENREEEQYYLDFYTGSPWCYNLNSSATGGPSRSLEQLSAAGKKSSELGLGVHALNKEQLSENGRKGGKNCKVEGAGIHADPGRGGRDPETHSQHSRKAGLATKERKAGWFSRTPEEHSTDSRKGMANTNLQVWEDPYDNFRGNPGHVAKHMRAHGRNPMEKVRVI